MSRRASLRAAMRAYVRGHDRAWERTAKLGERAGEAESEVEFGSVPATPRFGVRVPERLDFRRGPATHRDRLPDAGADSHG